MNNAALFRFSTVLLLLWASGCASPRGGAFVFDDPSSVVARAWRHIDHGYAREEGSFSHDQLLKFDAGTLPIQKLDRTYGRFTVYNFEVDELHTYFVSHERILVHNKALARPVYEQGSGHWLSDTAEKSRAPLDGQGALNDSIQAKGTSPLRVGIDSDGSFVLFSRHAEGVGSGPDVFHGHVRPWNELPMEAKNALIKAGLVNRRGKIIE